MAHSRLEQRAHQPGCEDFEPLRNSVLSPRSFGGHVALGWSRATDDRATRDPTPEVPQRNSPRSDLRWTNRERRTLRDSSDRQVRRCRPRTVHMCDADRTCCGRSPDDQVRSVARLRGRQRLRRERSCYASPASHEERRRARHRSCRTRATRDRGRPQARTLGDHPPRQIARSGTVMRGPNGSSIVLFERLTDWRCAVNQWPDRAMPHGSERSAERSLVQDAAGSGDSLRLRRS